MNAVYPTLRRALSQQELHAGTVDWWVLPLDPDAIYDWSLSVLGDVSADAVGAGVQLTMDGIQTDTTWVRYLTSGTYELTDIANADEVGAFVIYADDGVDTWLGAWIDTRSDTGPVAFVGTGATVQFAFPGGWFIQI